MSSLHPILVIDQGTTSSRAIIFDASTQAIISQHSQSLTQNYPNSGWVEQDPDEIFSTVIHCAHRAIEKAQMGKTPMLAMAISNQRETTLVWHKKTGKVIYPAIVWQDRRTQAYCEQLKQQGHESIIQEKTGLVIDPYFSASKIRWILDHVPNAQASANKGDLCFGTVDSWLIWRLTHGRHHVTDITNASRTQLFNIKQQQWDQDLLKLFNIPESLLPEVKGCHGYFGDVDSQYLDPPLPILSCIGDQQSALVGQACFKKGMAKSTFGTGCFFMMNTETDIIHSSQDLLTTIAYSIKGQTHYALEGSIFNAGSTIEWLKDNLQLFQTMEELEYLASQSDKDGIYFVPALTGLGSPYWQPGARGALFGLDRATGIPDIVKAALDAACFQNLDLQVAIKNDGITPTLLRVDGGMTHNNWLMQRLANILDLPIQRAQMMEITALGAMMLAALELGIYNRLDETSTACQPHDCFNSSLSQDQRDQLYRGWKDAIARVLT